jgi:hypothetical protein
MAWGQQQQSGTDQGEYNPWRQNQWLNGWNPRAEAWEEYWAEWNDATAETDEEPVHVKKHRRKVK